jgi:hypothetical protein
MSEPTSAPAASVEANAQTHSVNEAGAEKANAAGATTFDEILASNKQYQAEVTTTASSGGLRKAL